MNTIFGVHKGAHCFTFYHIMTTIQGFLDCTNRPFDSHIDGRIPDGQPTNSVMVMDYYEDNSLTTPTTSSTFSTSLSAVGMYYTYGQNAVRDNTYFYNGTSATDTLYGMVFFFLDANGDIINWSVDLAEATLGVKLQPAKLTPELIKIQGHRKVLKSNNNFDTNSLDSNESHYRRTQRTLDDTKEQVISNLKTTQESYFWCRATSNIASLCGSSDGFNDAAAFAVNMRLISAGIRFWPIIELITTSSTLAISRFYGFQITPESLHKTANNGDDIYNVARDMPQFKEYTNKEGVEGRVNIMQEHPFKLYEMMSLETMDNQYITTNAHFFPCLLARLTTSGSVTTNGAYSSPVRADFRSYMEVVPMQPTFIISSRVPLLYGWDVAAKTFAYKTDLYPTITSGHSFAQVGLQFLNDVAMATMHPSLLMLAGAANTVEVVYNHTKKRAGRRRVPTDEFIKRFKRPTNPPSRPNRGQPKSRTFNNPRMRLPNRGMANYENRNIDRANRVPPEIKLNSRPRGNPYPSRQRGRARGRYYRR